METKVKQDKPYVLGITGASAQPIAERTLKLLLENRKSVQLILSKGAYNVLKSENNINVPADPETQVKFWRERLRTEKGNLVCHRWNDNSANIASGSYITEAMLIVPCSMGTVGRIAAGISQNLIERCADVHIKEGRALIISPRESPLSLIHLKNLTFLSKAGVKIVPPMPAWYTNPKNIEQMIDFIVVRLLDSLEEDLDIKLIDRWIGK